MARSEVSSAGPPDEAELASWQTEIRRILYSRTHSWRAVEDDLSSQVNLNLRSMRPEQWAKVKDRPAYVAVVAQNVANDFLEQQRKDRERFPAQGVSAGIADESADVEEWVLREQNIERVRLAIGQLPLVYHPVLELHLKGRTVAQIAQQLGRGFETVRKQLTRAYAQLRVSLGSSS